MHKKELNKVTLEIEPELVYENKEEIIGKILNTLYVGKCFRNCFIKEIVDFNILSKIRFPVYRANGSGIVDINIVANVFELVPGDIIVGCIINKFSDDVIILQKDNIHIYIKSSPLIEKLKLKRKINVLVGEAKFENFSTSVITSAIPYFFKVSEQQVQYLVKADNGSKQEFGMEYIQNLMVRLKELNTKFEECKNADFFRKIAYPFKKEKIFESNLVVIQEIEYFENKYIISPIELFLDDNRVAISDEPMTYDGKVISIVECNWFHVMRLLLLEKIKFITMLIEMEEEYDIEENKLLWMLYDYFKKD